MTTLAECLYHFYYLNIDLGLYKRILVLFRKHPTYTIVYIHIMCIIKHFYYNEIRVEQYCYRHFFSPEICIYNLLSIVYIGIKRKGDL